MDTGFSEESEPTTDETSLSSSSTTSTEVQCFYEARALKNCPAPEITTAYVGPCADTVGLVIVGHYFQSVDRPHNTFGWVSHVGPALVSPVRDTWNELTPQRLCVTSYNFTAGTTVQLRNPDGKLSNTAVIEDRRSNPPPLPASNSSDPFDLDACADPTMTSDEALARFDAGSDTAALGSFAIVSQSRNCNTITGCAVRGAVTPVTTLPLGLSTYHPSSFQVRLNGANCNTLSRLNSCLPGPVPNNDSYQVRVGSTCAQIRGVVRSAVQGNGNYTRTDYVGLLRY